VAHATQQIDVVGAIIAAAAAPLERPDLGEAAFPKTQNMLRNVDLLSNFADRAECVRRLFQGPFSRSLLLERDGFKFDRHRALDS